MENKDLQNKMMGSDNDPVEGEIAKECDIALRPTGPIPPGYSNQAYPKCDTKTGTWYWYDPHIAP